MRRARKALVSLDTEGKGNERDTLFPSFTVRSSGTLCSSLPSPLSEAREPRNHTSAEAAPLLTGTWLRLGEDRAAAVAAAPER
jgi:hypothetical protein